MYEVMQCKHDFLALALTNTVNVMNTNFIRIPTSLRKAHSLHPGTAVKETHKINTYLFKQLCIEVEIKIYFDANMLCCVTST